MIKIDRINKLRNRENEAVYPVTISHAVYMRDGKTTLQQEIDDIKDHAVKYNTDNTKLEHYDNEDDKWKIVPIEGVGSSDLLLEDIKVLGCDVGSLSEGTFIKRGIRLSDLFVRMLTKIIPPTYKKPTLSITSNILSAELGSTIEPSITLNFVKNDGGDKVSCLFSNNGQEILNSYSFKLKPFRLSSSRRLFAVVKYAEGPDKVNNAGEVDTNGKILSGEVSSSMTIVPYRGYFAYASDNAVIPDASAIRSQNIKGINLLNGNKVTVTASEKTRNIVFAYPKSIKECSSIRYEELNDDNNKSAFTQTTEIISDADGKNPIEYRVYYYSSLVPFGTKATFVMTV